MRWTGLSDKVYSVPLRLERRARPHPVTLCQATHAKWKRLGAEGREWPGEEAQATTAAPAGSVVYMWRAVIRDLEQNNYSYGSSDQETR